MNEKSTHVVVLGAGYAGLMAAMRLAKKTDSRDVTITLVGSVTVESTCVNPAGHVTPGSLQLALQPVQLGDSLLEDI